jgi:hypothetical protein
MGIVGKNINKLIKYKTMDIEFNGLNFHVENNNLDKSYIVVKKRFPDSLLKFYKNDEYSVDAFTKNYLYLTHASQFNDSFEANNGFFDFSRLTEDDYNECC